MPTLRKIFSALIFFSRWLQAPLYLGLIIALGVYAYVFIVDLLHLTRSVATLDDTTIMMDVLDLIDVVMIANLLIMVIVGGYEIFVSRLNLHNHPDQPEWLDEVNAGTMKVKLSVALISISSIHLLRTFFDINKMTSQAIMWQVIIHVTLLISAVAVAFTNNLIASNHNPKRIQIGD